jgi:3-methylfumaryl-CoA hydratase
LVRAHDPRPLASFSFRGRAPLFDLGPFRLLGHPGPDGVQLEARGPDDRTALTASASWRG